MSKASSEESAVDKSLPNVGIERDTVVEGTTPNAGQPVVASADEEAAVYVTDAHDPNFVGLVELRYNGTEAYSKDGVQFAPGEQKTVGAVHARGFVANDSNFEIL